MSQDLAQFVGEELTRPCGVGAVTAARALARQFDGTQAVLFYGSVLRTRDPDGVADFYVLTRHPPAGLRGVASRALWPDVSYQEFDTAEGPMRAKVASMTIGQFERAASGAGADTTIWTRFVQPAALVWREGAVSTARTSGAITEAVKTAARFAAALGPREGTARAYWEALFHQTYAAELRFEAKGRGQTILDFDPGRYERLLPLAWEAAGIDFDTGPDGALSLRMKGSERHALRWSWRMRRTLGRPLNAARLVKAAFTFEGAARYAAWKVERHTGVALPLTPWRERHPILAAPGALWRLWRAKRGG